MARPRAPLAFNDAVAEIGERTAWERGRVVPKGQSILLVHDRRTPVAVLLLHGFTNSPQQFDSLGRMLYRAGANVYIPRLPHHALVNGGIPAIAQLTAEELRAASDSATDLAAALGDTVVVAGLSLGGVMAAWIAQFRPEAARAIAIAPPLGLYSVPRLADGPLVNLAVRLHGFTHIQRDSLDPDRESGWNTHAIGEILRFGVAARRAADSSPPKCKSIDILLNGHDRTIAAAPVISLGRAWQAHGADVHVFELPASLGLRHDVIDPRQPIRRPDVVYPALIAMVNGREPSTRDVADRTTTILQPR
jgi:carboxylesterase